MADGDGRYDVIVIGAGLVGLATAMALLAQRPGLRLAVLEKEAAVGTHQSGHNSGVIHAGLYYQPDSLKARFCTAGRLAMMEFAEQHQIPYRQTGKLVVATRDSELPRLASLAERGRANGLAVREIGAGRDRRDRAGRPRHPGAAHPGERRDRLPAGRGGLRGHGPPGRRPGAVRARRARPGPHGRRLAGRHGRRAAAGPAW